MDQAKKQQAKAELSVIRSLNSGTMGMTGSLNQVVFPTTGPVVNIPLFATVGQVMRQQNDVVEKLITLVDKLLDEIP